MVGLDDIWKERGHKVILINIYSPCDLVSKKRLWEDLKTRKMVALVAFCASWGGG